MEGGVGNGGWRIEKGRNGGEKAGEGELLVHLAETVVLFMATVDIDVAL